jgi:hypothetical protein
VESNGHKQLTKETLLGLLCDTEGWFDYSFIDKELSIGTNEGKATRRVVLSRMVKDRILDKHPSKEGTFRFIRQELDDLEWTKADPTAYLHLAWPYGVEDQTRFEALDCMKIYPGSVMVVAGVSNRGKTTFCLGFLTENMDSYDCVYFTNELGAEEMKSRMMNYTWVKPLDEEGKPKFRTVTRYDHYEDVIQPDCINIIDYLDPGENPYEVGIIIDKIRQKLGKGIALIAIQKKEIAIHTKDGIKTQSAIYGTGGQYSEHRARLVIHIDHDVLFIKKAKSWHTHNPNGKKYSFKIVEYGSHFHDISDITEEGK